jgi:predicted nucleotidyltransferase
MVLTPYNYGDITMRDKESIVINYLISNKNKELNIKNLSYFLKIDYKNIYNIIKRLEKKKVIFLEKFGNSSKIKLIQKINPIIYQSEFERRNKILKNKNILVMLNNFKKEISTNFFSILLFGSYAKGTQSKKSDIDLIFIFPNEDMYEEEVIKISQIMPLNLHTLVFSEKQFLEMMHSQESNVIKEALEYNVILYGIEYYYELIS